MVFLWFYQDIAIFSLRSNAEKHLSPRLNAYPRNSNASSLGRFAPGLNHQRTSLELTALAPPWANGKGVCTLFHRKTIGKP